MYFAVGGDGEGDDRAKPKTSDSATSGASRDVTDEPTDEPTDEQTEEFTDPPDDFGNESAGPHSKEDGFKGQWQDDGGKTLTIGAKLQSGQGAGKNSVSYIEPGGDGFCVGLGQERSGGAVFRIALKCGSGKEEKYVSGNSKQDGESITITWDKGGGTDTLDWIGD